MGYIDATRPFTSLTADLLFGTKAFRGHAIYMCHCKGLVLLIAVVPHGLVNQAYGRFQNFQRKHVEIFSRQSVRFLMKPKIVKESTYGDTIRTPELIIDHQPSR